MWEVSITFSGQSLKCPFQVYYVCEAGTSTALVSAADDYMGGTETDVSDVMEVEQEEEEEEEEEEQQEEEEEQEQQEEEKEGKRCREVEAMRCSIEKRTVRKAKPVSSCRRIPTKMCAKKKCKKVTTLENSPKKKPENVAGAP